MYAEFYGLTAQPFQLTPDARFFYESTVHRQAMAYLVYGLHHAEGFIIITGEVGAGKTILVDNLLSTIDRKTFVAAKIVTTHLAAEDLLHMVAPLASARQGRARERLAAAAHQRLCAFPAPQRQTLAPDHRRGAKPVLRSARRAPYALQYHPRPDYGATELLAGAAAIPNDTRQPAARAASSAGDRSLPFRSTQRSRGQGLCRAPAAPSRVERRPELHRGLLPADPPIHRRRPPADQHALLEAPSFRLSGAAAHAYRECCREGCQ